MTTASSSVILTKDPTTWPIWLAELKWRAMEAEVWPYFNPETEVPEPEKPTFEQAITSIESRIDAHYVSHLERWHALPADQKGKEPQPTTMRSL